MMVNFSKIFTFFFLALLPLCASAQNSIKAVLVEETSGAPVSYATVSLTAPGSKTVYKYTLSSENGSVLFEKVKNGTYTFKAELMGLVTYTQEIKVNKTVDLGTIRMKEDTQVLDAAKVSAVGNPVTIKKDTVEYNASSFKTTDNDVLEDLLKKLPGVEVSEDGSVTFNGETIKKITIDGKTFFLDDPQLASKNIPAKIVNKLKVFEKKSDQAMFTGVDDGNEETVIDLSLKPGMMKGAFGNIMAGGGHDVPTTPEAINDYRYQGAAFVGNFTDKQQLSAIVNINNTNNRGFNDLAGSMMGGMRGGGGGMGRGQGGWGRGNGITTSYMGGANGAWTLCDGNMDLAGNYLFSGTRKAVLENSDKITYLDDHNLNYTTQGNGQTNTYGHRMGVRLEHKFSENTSILFQPQLNFGNGNFNEFSKFNTNSDYFDGRIVKTNEGFNMNTGENRNITTNGFFLFRQKLGKPGRTISANINYNYSNNDLNGYNQSMTKSFVTDGSQNESVNQRYEQNRNAASVSGRVSYTEPLTERFFAEANYSISWNKSTSWKNTYDNESRAGYEDYNPDHTWQGGTFNPVYSNNIVNRYVNQTAGLSLVYQMEKIRAQLGVRFNPTDTHNETTRNGQTVTYDSKVSKWSPNGMLFFEPNDNLNMRMFYWGQQQQPEVSMLMPVPDNTNPLNIAFGNPQLKPYFQNNLRGHLRYNNKQNFTSVNVNINGSLVQSPIVRATWNDPNGVQYSMPYNGPDSGNIGLRLFATIPIGKSNFSINEIFNTNYSNSTSFVGSNIETSKYYNDGEMDYEAFLRDYGDLENSKDFTMNKTQSLSVMERLRVIYRLDNLELRVSGRMRFSKPWYTIAYNETPMTWNNQIEASAVWTIESAGITFKPEFRYNWYRGYTTPQDPEYILNAEISKLLFKKKFTLAAKMYDILGQSKNLNISDSENTHVETLNNTLGRYLIISLTYRFGTFDQSKMRMGPGMGGHRR